MQEEMTEQWNSCFRLWKSSEKEQGFACSALKGGAVVAKADMRRKEKRGEVS